MSSVFAMKKAVDTRNPNLQPSLKVPVGAVDKSAAGDDVVVELWRRNERGDSSLIGERPDTWWTGKRPVHSECPGVSKDGIITSLPAPNLSTVTREEALAYFDNTWTITDVLFSGLQSEEAFYRPPYHLLRHPMVFYYAHPACVYINKLRVAGLLEHGIDAANENLFETGVDEMSWDDVSDGSTAWPSIQDLVEYRRKVYAVVRELILSCPDFDTLPITPKSKAWGIFMGLEHERIHIETSSVLIRELPKRLVSRPKWLPPYHPSFSNPSNPVPHVSVDYPANEFIAVPSGDVVLGKPADFSSFGWDNEYGHKAVHVNPFEATKFKVTNGEFLQFVRSGGYHDQKYWSADGWKWKMFRNVKWPTFWIPEGPAGLHQYKYRTVFEVIDMPWSWPVDANWYEGEAYCHWLQLQDGSKSPYRMIAEVEHHRIRDSVVVADSAVASSSTRVPVEADHVMLFDGRSMAAVRGINVNMAFMSSSPVDAFPASSKGFHDVFGNIWEWCGDDVDALPGFSVHPIYDDFSTPCFDGRHRIILGGSFVSTGDEASIFSRFHFRPHFYQHAGFRVVRSSFPNPANVKKADLMYEDRTILNEYLQLHFGAGPDVLPFSFGPHCAMEFPRRSAQFLAKYVADLQKLNTTETASSSSSSSPSSSVSSDSLTAVPFGRALDLGCAVGGAVFELARSFSSVLGLDLSQQFINAANELKSRGQMSYFAKKEGVVGTTQLAEVDQSIDRSRCEFAVGDACALSTDAIGTFDAVLMANLLCRTANPRACLSQFKGPHGILRSGGLLAITTPTTWMEAFTPQKEWLGGYYRDGGVPVTTLDGIRETLSDFKLVHVEDMPLIIREHERKYQFIVAQASIWQKL